jgi:molybdopterin synthase catalytic subunit
MPVRLARGPISWTAAFRALAGPGLGGVVVFAGRVRPDRTRGGRVVALEYEVDPRPALVRLKEIERTARRRFGVRRVVVWHRVGRVPVGAVSVVVGAAGGHRAPSFAAARFLIEQVKVTVPLWKEARVRSGRRPRPPRSRPARRSAG